MKELRNLLWVVAVGVFFIGAVGCGGVEPWEDEVVDEATFAISPCGPKQICLDGYRFSMKTCLCELSEVKEKCEVKPDCPDGYKFDRPTCGCVLR